MKAEKQGYEQSAIRICLEQGEMGDVCGSLHTVFRKEKTVFNNAVTLIMELEEILEERGFPNATCSRRTFKGLGRRNQKVSEPSLLRSMEQIKKEYGTVATLLLYVTSRNHAGIQGRIVSVGDGTIYEYGSELEMLAVCEKIIKQTEIENTQKIVSVR